MKLYGYDTTIYIYLFICGNNTIIIFLAMKFCDNDKTNDIYLYITICGTEVTIYIYIYIWGK